MVTRVHGLAQTVGQPDPWGLGSCPPLTLEPLPEGRGWIGQPPD